jgi:senataxin
VHFSEKFRRSFKRVRTQQSKISVINVLERLANGWRPRGHSIEIVCENSSKILKQFKVETRYIICSIEIVNDLRGHIQVLKMWDLVSAEDIPKLAKRLDCEFRRYTDEYFVFCKEKGFDG